MSLHVALLRAINVGGRNKVAMSDLRDLLGALGFADARSLLQSGNLVFQSGRRTGAGLERLLEIETDKRLGIAVDYLVRSAEEWNTIVEANPFPTEAESMPNRLIVMFLKESPEAKDIKTLQAAISGPEIVRAVGRQLYAVYPAGMGESKLTNAVIERKLGTRATARNWNTTLKLADLLGE